MSTSVISIEDKVIKIIYDQLKPHVSFKEVSPEKLLVEDLGMDSLDRVEISMAVEETFGIENIPDEDANELIRVRDIMNYVKKKKA